MSSPDVHALLDVAEEELGYVESDNNYNKYGKWYGLNNQPYSAIFVSWCFAKIGKSNLVSVTSDKGFASCHLAYEHFKNNNQLINPRKAQAGDIVFLNYYESDSGRVNHVGIVKEVSYAKLWLLKLPVALVTIEANVTGELGSTSIGQDCKNGVYKRIRVFGEDTRIVAVARPRWT